MPLYKILYYKFSFYSMILYHLAKKQYKGLQKCTVTANNYLDKFFE